MKAQPAKKNYFFGKAFSDLKKTISESFSLNTGMAEDFFDEASGTFLPSFYWGLGIAVFVFGTIVFSVCSIIHIIFLSLVAFVIYMIYSFVWLLDAGYRKWKKIFMACPHSNCYARSFLPVYHCPKCNAKHDQLYPGAYGILKRTCRCGEKLPTTFFNGRNKLPATCPVCGQPIKALEARPIAIPIVGAPSVGKTFLVFSMVWYIKEKFAKKMGLQFQFMDTYNENNYNSEIKILNSGNFVRKTTENNPIALNFFLSKDQSKSLLYFYDSAGEAFASTQNLVQHKFYDYFHGLIFVIDPFSIPDVSFNYQKQLASLSHIKPSSTPLEDVYDTLIINLEKNYKIKTTERITKPVAIVFSKVDAFNLSDIIGNNAVAKLMASNSAIKSPREAMNQLCKQFLKDNGMEHVLRKMEWKFSNAQYFAISSNGQKSIGVDDVTDWLLGKVTNF